MLHQHATLSRRAQVLSVCQLVQAVGESPVLASELEFQYGVEQIIPS
jgi:hypothetical protein